MDKSILPTTALNLHALRELKNQLHLLKPSVVIKGKGLTDEVVHNIDRALDESELVKIRTYASSAEELTKLAEAICTNVKAVLVQSIGYIIAIYRKNLVVEE